jgi:hypothetical protein
VQEIACLKELSTIPYGQGDTPAQRPVGVQWASIEDDQKGEGIVPIEVGLENKFFGQPLLLPCQCYCFLLFFLPQIVGAQGNGLLPPALGVGLPLGGLGLLESV